MKIGFLVLNFLYNIKNYEILNRKQSNLKPIFRINKSENSLFTDTDIQAFTARYLNAIRLPENTLITWYNEQKEKGLNSKKLPNFCQECEHQKTCHEGFGQVKGMGLYPFNFVALKQMLYRVNQGLVEENFTNDPPWILDNNNFKGQIFSNGIKKITIQLQQKLKNSWQKYLKQKMPTTNEDLLNLLEKISSFKDTINQIKRLKENINKIEYPQNKEEFKLIEQYISIIRENWESLESDEIPDSIIIFLKAAANEGATLNLLTAEVKDWLITHNLSDNIRIKLIS